MTNNEDKQHSETHEYYFGSSALSPIPLTVQSPVIKPLDKGKLTATAVESMEGQARQQIELLKQQAALLIEQARKIEERLQVSYLIYQSEFKFQPVIGKSYYLYETEDRKVLSPISPDEWGNKMPYKRFLNHVKLLGDQTWEIMP